ncbi:MAG: tetratricopeptide repeat protein [Blastocatellia bacterium]|nr:tetratricopeptide repeat protein [Blastocatellia bacterium]
MKLCPICNQEYTDEVSVCADDGAVLEAADPMLGQLLEGKYRIEKRIGTGGMATVYLANRVQIGDNVAVKILNAESLKNPLAVARFRREAQAAARIKHSGVVTIHDLGNLPEGNTFLVMEYVDGYSLRDELKKAQQLSTARAMEIMIAVCAGVQAAHDAGIIHRDLKPENIMIEPHRGGIENIKVVDFGVAELREHVISDALTKLTEAGMMVGTPYYISPEQCKGEDLDTRSDLYSLGIILYEMLTGVVPFRGKTLSAVIIQHATEAPAPLRPLRPDVSEELEAVVMQTLAKDRNMRPTTATALAQRLRQVISNVSQHTGDLQKQKSSEGTEQAISAALRGTTGNFPQVRRSGLINYDSLTGLHSYAYFTQRLEEILAKLAQTNELLSIAFLGIDGFKKINDTYGYLIGDLAIREVGILLNEKAPSDMLICRSPGDGFVMMAVGELVKDFDKTLEQLKKITAETKFLQKDIPGGQYLSLSVGAAKFPEDGIYASDLVESAQRALRQDKLARRSLNGVSLVELTTNFDSFVGRNNELERLNREFESSISGRGRLLFIVGDAGLGKTKLVEEFRKKLAGRDILFLQGRFYESGGAVPYKVFCDSLRGSIHYLAEHASENVDMVFGSLTEKVINDFTNSDPLSFLLSHETTVSSNAEQEKFKIFDYLTKIYISLAKLRPLILFLDDLQWADELTLDFLAYLIRATADERVFIVATMREWEISNEGNPVRTWLRQMSRYGSYEQIKLAPLNEKEVELVLELIFGKIEISSSMLTRLLTETKGNAFYLSEIVRLLLEEKVISPKGGKWVCEDVAEIKLPSSIVDLVEAHLAKLPATALDVFTQAAVLGDGFTFETLQTVTELDEDDLLSLVETGLREHILKEEMSGREDRYVFYHSTLRKVLYERTSRRRRKKLHQQIGRKLEELYADRANKIAAELVYHYHNAEDYGHALRYAVEAGNLAWRAMAVSEAAKYYEWAEKSIESLTLSLAEGGIQTDPGNKIMQLAACGLHLEVDRLALYHLNYGRLLMHIGNHQRAESELRQTLEFARQVRSLQMMGRTFVALGELYRQYGQLARSLEYGEQGLALLTSIEDCEWEVQALMVIGAAYEGIGRFSQAIENYEGAMALARKLNDKVNEGNALCGLGLTHYRLGQYEKAKDSARRAYEIAYAGNDRLGQQRSLKLIGSVMLEVGQYDDALNNFDTALKIARDLGYRVSEAGLLNSVGDYYRRRGVYQEASAYFHQSLALALETFDKVTECVVMLNIGLAHQGRGEHEVALRELQKAEQIAIEIGAKPTEIEILISIADSLRVLGRVTEAVVSYKKALDLARQSGSLVFEWRALYGLALCEKSKGEKKLAANLLQKSIEVIEMMSSELNKFADRVNFLKSKQIVYNDLAELSQEFGTTPGAGRFL